jgi:hypothetical protein
MQPPPEMSLPASDFEVEVVLPVACRGLALLRRFRSAGISLGRRQQRAHQNHQNSGQSAEKFLVFKEAHL